MKLFFIFMILSEHKAKKLIEAFCRYATDSQFDAPVLETNYNYIIDQSSGIITVVGQFKSFNKDDPCAISGYIYSSGNTYQNLLKNIINSFNKKSTFFNKKCIFTGIQSPEEFALRLAVLGYFENID